MNVLLVSLGKHVLNDQFCIYYEHKITYKYFLSQPEAVGTDKGYFLQFWKGQ